MPDISLFPKEYAVETPQTNVAMSVFAVLSYIFIVLIFAAWGGLYFYKNYLQEEINGLDAQIQASPLQGKQDEIKKIKSAETLLTNFNKALASHVYLSNIFTIIEDYTLKKGSLNKFSVDTKDSSAVFGGIVDSYEDFAKQLGKFKTESGIVKRADIDSLKFSRIGIEFQLKFLLDKNIWLKSND